MANAHGFRGECFVIEVETKLSGSLLEGLDKYEKRIQDECGILLMDFG